MSTLSAPGDLAGQVVWIRPQGGLRNERPELISGLSTGRPASALPGLVSALLSMCGQAHLLASRLAVDAARGQARTLTEEEAQTLQVETLREHLRRLWLDWPRLLQGQVDASLAQLKALHEAPVLQGSLSRVVGDRHAVLDATSGWLSDQVFDMPPDIWLTRWILGGEAWLADWCRCGTSTPARLLAAVQPRAQATLAPLQVLRPDDEAALRTLAHQLATVAGHARQPAWPLNEVETGPWCRLHEPTESAKPLTLWWRMAGRLADLARLALPDGKSHGSGQAQAHVDQWPTGMQALRHGSLMLPDHAGLAWVEMARGTLIHWVQLDGAHPDARVRACQVVSPTEWNFHPQGPVARLLAAVPDGPDFAHQAAMIVAAYDPCVPFAIVTTDDPCPAEPSHA